MAFLTADVVISLPAVVAVFAPVHRPVFFWYLTLALTGSLATGLGYQLLVCAEARRRYPSEIRRYACWPT
jgi:hypothetical protein